MIHLPLAKTTLARNPPPRVIWTGGFHYMVQMSNERGTIVAHFPISQYAEAKALVDEINSSGEAFDAIPEIEDGDRPVKRTTKTVAKGVVLPHPEVRGLCFALEKPDRPRPILKLNVNAGKRPTRILMNGRRLVDVWDQAIGLWAEARGIKDFTKYMAEPPTIETLHAWIASYNKRRRTSIMVEEIDGKLEPRNPNQTAYQPWRKPAYARRESAS